MSQVNTANTASATKAAHYMVDVVGQKGVLHSFAINQGDPAKKLILAKGQKIVLRYADSNDAPETVYTIQNGRDTEVYLTDTYQPNLVVQVKDSDQAPQILGRAENGGYYTYASDTTTAYELGNHPAGGVWMSMTGAPALSVTDAAASSSLLSGMSASSIGLGVLGLAGVAAVAGAAGGSSSDGSSSAGVSTTGNPAATTNSDRTENNEEAVIEMPPTITNLPVGSVTVTNDALGKTVASGSSTNDTTPVVSGDAGSASAGNTITVHLGNQVVTTTVGNDGKWSVTAPRLAEGTYDVSVDMANPAGDTGTLKAGTLTVDTTAPVILSTRVFDDIASPSLPVSRSTRDTTPVFTGTTTSSDAGSAVSVKLTSTTGGTSMVVTGTVNADGSWSVTPSSPLDNGTYTTSVMLTDIAGNQSAPVNSSLLINTEAPPVSYFTWSTDTNNDGILNAAEWKVYPATGLEISTRGLKPGYQIFYTITGNQPGVVYHSSPFAVTQKMIDEGKVIVNANLGVTEGQTLTAVVKVVDLAGNSTIPYERTITRDTTAPVLSGLTVANDAGTPVAAGGFISDATPVLSGKTTPNDTVRVTVGDQTLTTVADSTGKWSVTPAELKDGSYTFAVTATDVAGNVATSSAGFTVDTVKPVIGNLTVTDDVAPVTGSVAAGSASNDSTPTVSGTGEAGAGVQVVVGGQTLTAVADSTGKWSVTPAALKDGAYTATITLSDKAGNVASTSTSFSVDTVAPAAPVITMQSDRNGDGYFNAAEWKAYPATGVTLSTGGMTVGDQLYYTLTGEQGAVYHKSPVTLTQKMIDDGSVVVNVNVPMNEGQTITATAYAVDAAGNTSSTSKSTLTRDIVAPVTTLNVTDDVAPVTGNVVAGGVTNDSTPVLSGTSEAGAKVQVVVGGQTLNAVADSTGKWSVTPAELKDGANTVTVTVTDVAGNTTVSGTSFNVDKTAPVLGNISITDNTAPVTGNVAAGGVTNDTTPTVSGAGEAGAAVQVVVGGQTLTTVADNTGKWSVTPVALKDGTYTATIVVTDSSGNTTTATADFGVDSTVPVIGTLTVTDNVAPVTGSVAAGSVSNDSTPTVSGTGEAGAGVQVVVGSQTLTTVADSTGKWSVTPAALKDGAYTAIITLSDKAGNVATATASFGVDTTAPAAPVITMQNDRNGDGYFNATEWSAYPATGVTLSTRGMSAGDQLYYTLTGSQGAIYYKSPVTLTQKMIEDGSVVVNVNVPLVEGQPVTATAYTVDAAGNTSSVSKSILTRDTVAPVTTLDVTDDAAPVTGNVGSGGLTNDATPAVSGTSEAGARIQVVVGGQTLTAVADNSGKWSVTPAELKDGANTATVTVTDVAGNSMVSSTSFNVDKTAPVLGSVSVSDNVTPVTGNVVAGGVTNDATPTVSGTGEAGAGVQVVVGSQTLTTVADSTGKWSVTPATLKDGAYIASISLFDKAGNIATATASFSVDTTAPAAPVISMQGDRNGDGYFNIAEWDVYPATGITLSTRGLNVGDQLYYTLTGSQGEVYQKSPVTLTQKMIDDGSVIVNVNVPVNEGQTITATAYVVDVAGNAGATSKVTLTRDTTLVLNNFKVTDNVSPVTGSIVSGGATNDNTPTFSGTSSAGDVVKLVVGDQTLTSVVGSTGNWSLTPAALKDGIYNASVAVSDKAGNIATAVSSFTVDTVAPKIQAMVHPGTDTGAVGDGFTTNTKPSIIGLTEAGATVTVVLAGQTMNTTAAANGLWTVTPSQALTNNKEYVANITVKDTAGLSSTAGLELTVGYVNHAPQIETASLWRYGAEVFFDKTGAAANVQSSNTVGADHGVNNPYGAMRVDSNVTGSRIAGTQLIVQSVGTVHVEAGKAYEFSVDANNYYTVNPGTISFQWVLSDSKNNTVIPLTGVYSAGTVEGVTALTPNTWQHIGSNFISSVTGDYKIGLMWVANNPGTTGDDVSFDRMYFGDAPAFTPRTYGVIGVDMDGDSKVSYGQLNTGTSIYGSVSKNDGALFFDFNNDGKLTNLSKQIGFSRDGIESNMAGLQATHDTNKDGYLTAADQDFSKFKIWTDANSNGTVDTGELKTLTDAKLLGLILSVSNAPAYPVMGVAENGQGVAVSTSGSAVITSDAMMTQIYTTLI